jgi:hypothetical protein
LKNSLWKFVSIGFVFAALVTVLTVQGMSAPAAHATVSCSGSTCTDKDPTTTVGPHGVFCNNNAFLQNPQINYSWGWIQNWWSQECNANWAVVNVNSGDSISFAGISACNGTTGFDSTGEPTCNGSVAWTAFLSTCDQVSGYNANCQFMHTDIGSGTTHWYTNMVRGDWKTVSRGVAKVGTSLKTMFSGWH